MNRMSGMKLILSFMLFDLFVDKTISQSNLQERNFEILQLYRDRVAANLSLECVWFLAPLFGQDEVFPSLPNAYQINNLEFVNDDLDHSFFDQNRLAPYIHNQDASYQISTALKECKDYGDPNSQVLVFLFNLLRNYVAIVERPHGLVEGKKELKKSLQFYSSRSIVNSLLLVLKNINCRSRSLEIFLRVSSF